MNFLELLKKKETLVQGRDIIPELTLNSFEQAFEIEYIHNSTAIEGNTLTLIETKLVLEEGISIGGKSLREIYEQINHRKAYRFVKECIHKNQPLDENAVKEIQALLKENILIGGVYRSVDADISGAQHTPPSPNEKYRQIKDFYADLTWKSRELNPIELAAWTHAEFELVKIHPFPDGNGITSRLIMNYQLMANGFPAISIAKENRLEYFHALQAYAVSGNLAPFADMVADLSNRQLDQYLSMMERAQSYIQNQSM